MGRKLDNIFLGMLMGVIAAVIGFIIFGLWWTKDYSWGLGHFYSNIFLGMNMMKIGTVSVLAQMLVFYILYRNKMVMASRGVMISILALTIFLVIRSL